MQILALSKDTPGASWEGREELLSAEAAHVWRLQTENVVRNVWFTESSHDAVLLLECPSLDEARRLIAGFPLVKNGLIAFELLALTNYDSYSRLFRK